MVKTDQSLHASNGQLMTGEITYLEFESRSRQNIIPTVDVMQRLIRYNINAWISTGCDLNHTARDSSGNWGE